MIPLHLIETTVHVSPAQAEQLVAASVAEWLPGRHGLRSTRASDREVLAALR